MERKTTLRKSSSRCDSGNMTKMADRMPIDILSAKKVIGEEERLRDGFFLSGFTLLFLCFLLLCLFQLAERVECSLTDLLRK